MIKPDEHTQKAIIRLNNENSDFKVFTEWLIKSLEQERSLSDTFKDEIYLRWSQGKRQMLQEQLDQLKKEE